MTEDINWDELLKLDMEFATSLLLDRGRIQPMFVIRKRDGTAIIVGTPFSSDDEKQRMYSLVQLMCVVYDAVGFSFIGEAWMRAMDRRIGENEKEMSERAWQVRPSEAPDRREIVTVTIVYRDEDANERKVISSNNEIIRDDAGKPISFAAFELPIGYDVTGSVSKILTKHRPSEMHRQAAEAMLKKVSPNWQAD